MDGNVRDLLINLAASVVAGGAVWAAQRLRRQRATARRLAFFGLGPGDRCLLVVPRHASSPREHSVHRRDVAALVELAAVARECGASTELVAAADPIEGLGRLTEFCVGGWKVNPRMATHLATVLPGVRLETDQPRTDPPRTDQLGVELAFTVGSVTYRQSSGHAEHAVLARVFPTGSGRPVFIIAGQSSRSNLAAARYLAGNDRLLTRDYRADRPFCLVVSLAEPEAYGSDLVAVVDVTDQAFQTPDSVTHPKG